MYVLFESQRLQVFYRYMPTSFMLGIYNAPYTISVAYLLVCYQREIIEYGLFKLWIMGIHTVPASTV